LLEKDILTFLQKEQANHQQNIKLLQEKV